MPMSTSETRTLRPATAAAAVPPAVWKKIAGTMSAIVASKRVELCARMPVLLKVCFSRDKPPANIAKPRTKSRLPMIEPVIEAFTTSISPALSAKMPMMSSVALPKVALRSPPTTGVVRVANSSVDWPMSLASGTMASAERKKTVTGETPAKAAPIAIGTKARSAKNRLSVAYRKRPIRVQFRARPLCRVRPGTAAASARRDIGDAGSCRSLSRRFPCRRKTARFPSGRCRRHRSRARNFPKSTWRRPCEWCRPRPLPDRSRP